MTRCVTRPRVEGEREDQILDATLAALLEVGYDKLTMDGVARLARASKATLYRRWETKASLVIEALIRSKGAPHAECPNTGSLRSDLISVYCGSMANESGTRVLGAMITALTNDPEFAAEFRARFIAPKVAVTGQIYAQAAERGEIRDDLDLDVIGPAMAGILMHRAFVLGLPTDDATIERVVDHVILPAVLHPASAQNHSPEKKATP